MKKHVGSSFDEFLAEEGLLGEAEGNGRQTRYCLSVE